MRDEKKFLKNKIHIPDKKVNKISDASFVVSSIGQININTNYMSNEVKAIKKSDSLNSAKKIINAKKFNVQPPTEKVKMKIKLPKITMNSVKEDDISFVLIENDDKDNNYISELLDDELDTKIANKSNQINLNYENLSPNNLLYSEDELLIYLDSKTKFKVDFIKMYRTLLYGIKDDLRERMWMKISGLENRIKNYPNEYKNLILKLPKNEEHKQIKKDLERTIIKNKLNEKIENPEASERILVAFTVSYPEIGYCQGMNFLVNTILYVIKNEEKAFWFFVYIMNDKDMKAMFSEDFIGLKSIISKLVNSIKTKLFKLYSHFLNNDVTF